MNDIDVIKEWVDSLTTVRVPLKVKTALKNLAAPKPKKWQPPPCPPVPKGYSRWEERGKGWESQKKCHIAFCISGDEHWDTAFEKAGGYRDFYYLEAIK